MNYYFILFYIEINKRGIKTFKYTYYESRGNNKYCKNQTVIYIYILNPKTVYYNIYMHVVISKKKIYILNGYPWVLRGHLSIFLHEL